MAFAKDAPKKPGKRDLQKLSEQYANMDTDDFISSLTEGTQAHFLSETSHGVMHSREKIPTPIPHLNCILGGGLPLGIIVEMYGDPASGKSSTAYQTAAEFQKKYPDGIIIIVDTEASVDAERMPFLGITNPKRVMRIPATSIESGFDQVLSILQKKALNPNMRETPVLILWDTIGANASENELESGSQFSDGMMGNAKLLKFHLKRLFPQIEAQPILIILLNQVSTQQGMYPNQTKLGSSGGWGIKHDAHLRILFKGGSTETLTGADDDIFTIFKNSSFSMEKSKISPMFKGLPIVIDNREGGKIDGIRSFMEFCREKLKLVTKDSWAKISPVMFEHFPEYMSHFKYQPDSKFYWKQFIQYVTEERPKLAKVFELEFVNIISSIYKYQSVICAPYREQLLKEIEAPEPHDEGNGKVVDLWTGTILTQYDPNMQYADIDLKTGRFVICPKNALNQFGNPMPMAKPVADVPISVPIQQPPDSPEVPMPVIPDPVNPVPVVEANEIPTPAEQEEKKEETPKKPATKTKKSTTTAKSSKKEEEKQ